MHTNRRDALLAEEPFFFTGEPCRNGHFSKRRTGCSTCVQCRSIKYKNWLGINNNKIRRIKYIMAWQKEHPEKFKSYLKLSVQRHPERRAEQGGFRRALRRNATPKWADRNEIRSIYKIARELTEQTGIRHDVDHIIPLKGRNVCGLHVANNLRAIPATDNYRKHNSFCEEALGKPHQDP